MRFAVSPVAALAAVVLWSTNAWVADLALRQMSVEWLLLVQFASAAAALLVGRAVTSRATARPSGGRSVTAAAVGVVGLTGTIFLQYLAFATAPIVAANVLAYAWPLLAAVWIMATVRTRRSVGIAGLALLGFAGVGLIFAGPGTDGQGTAATWGFLAALGSAVCMASYTVAAGRLPARTTTLLLPATMRGAVVAGVAVTASGAPWPAAAGWAAAVYLGLGPMAAGYLLWTAAMAGGNVDQLAPIGYATPLLSTVVLLAGGATATVSTLVGLGLVLACNVGVLAAQRPRRRIVVRSAQR